MSVLLQDHQGSHMNSIQIGDSKFSVEFNPSSHTHPLNLFQCISSLILQMAGTQLNYLNQLTKNNSNGILYLTVMQDVKKVNAHKYLVVAKGLRQTD